MTIHKDTPRAPHKDTPRAPHKDTPRAPHKDTPRALDLSEQELTALAKSSLDDSVESIDAATLSRLNQARQEALASSPQPWLRRVWLPVSAAGFAVLALGIALPLLKPGQPTMSPEAVPMVEEAYQAAAQDVELMEDLDLVLMLMDAEDHAS